MYQKCPSNIFHFVQGLSRTPLLLIPRYLTNIFPEHILQKKYIENQQSGNPKNQVRKQEPRNSLLRIASLEQSPWKKSPWNSFLENSLLGIVSFEYSKFIRWHSKIFEVHQEAFKIIRRPLGGISNYSTFIRRHLK